MILTKADFQSFKDWLDLDVNSIAWEGRYAESFSGFWDSFFKDQIAHQELSERFELAKRIAKSGPLISWLSWLHEKFICFGFIHRGHSIRELALLYRLPERHVSTVLRDHFIKVHPASEDLINESFQVSNASSENLFLKFQDLEQELGSAARERGTFEDDILAHMEVTLYPDWPNLVKELRKDILSIKVDLGNLQRRTTFKKQMRFVQEVILLLLVLSLVAYALKNANRWYENYLVNKITLFEPNFFWLDKTITYQEQDLLAKMQIDLSNKELDDLEKIEAQRVFSDEVTNSRFDPESDVVVLDSVDDVPKSFGGAETAKSEYEETKKGGYRDSSNPGSTKKAYRVLMASVAPDDIKERILPLIKQYGISQASNVKPGTRIPGGLYFNLMVPSARLKDFMSKVTSYSGATIFESRSEGGDVTGKNRVFIWIKSI